MKVLYLKGSDPGIDAATTQQLRSVAADLDITSVESSAEALIEIRKAQRFQALIISPTLSQNETLALIASLRRDRVPIAIVPVVDEAHQDLYAAAISSGADDVLLRRGESLANVSETLTRARQSPHRFPIEHRRRLGVLYAGRDTLVWNLLEQVPFVKAERVTCGPDGSCPVHTPGATDGSLRCDAVVIDEHPGEAHPLQVLKSIKAQASDLPIVVLTSSGTGDIATAALELGADDTVLKSGIFRRRLIATLRRVHQRIELQAQQAETKAREERLRQIVERVPSGIAVVAADSTVLAMNAEGLRLFGAARPREVVGRDVRTLVAPEDREAMTDLLRRVTKGEPGALEFDGETLGGERVPLALRATVLERDARGGRGMIAYVAPASPQSSTSADEGRAGGTADLAAALGQVERVREETAALHAQEAAERRELEDKLAAAEATLRTMDDLREQVERANAERLAAEARLTEERETWRSTELALSTTADQLTTGQARVTDLEHALFALRDELQQTTDAHRAEGDAWADERRRLESRLREVEDAARAQADAAAEARRLEETARTAEEAFAEERRSWDEQRAALESTADSRRVELEAARTDLAAAREALDQSRQEADRVREAERAEWDQARHALDTARHESDERLAGERSHWEEARRALEVQHEDAERARERERAAWEDTRAGLERAEREARERLEAERSAWDSARASLEAARRDVEQTFEAARAEWEDTRRALEAAQSGGETLEIERSGWERTRVELEADRQRLEAELAATRAEWDEAREQLESGRSHLETLLDAERGESRRIREQLERAEQGLDERMRHERDEWARTREQFDASRRALEDTLAVERNEWQQVREQLEGRAADLEHALEAERARVADLQQQVDAMTRLGEERITAERASWTEARHRLEQDLRDRDAAVAAERASGEHLREALEQAQHACRALEAEQQAWQAARTELSRELDGLRAARGEREALEAALDAVRAELAHTDAARAADRAEWEATRTALEQALTAAEATERQAREDLRASQARQEQQAADTEALRRDHERMNEALAGLRTEHATLVETLAAVRAAHEQDVRELGVVRDALALAETRRTELEAHASRADQERAAAWKAQELEDQNLLMASTLVGCALMTPAGEVRRCNDAFARLFGYADAANFTNRIGSQPFGPLSGRADLDAKLHAAGRFDREESCVDRLDGRAIRVLESARVLPPHDGESLIERTFVELPTTAPTEDLRARRLEEVGALAAAMAPGIEEMLTSLEQRSQALQQVADPDTHRDEAARCEKLAVQAAVLVRQLVAFSRRQASEVESVDLDDAIRQAEPMLTQLVGDYVGFDVRLGAETPLAANGRDIDQLLTSLVTFGRDVLPAGGSLVIETRPVASIDGPEGRTERGTMLSVSASGYGLRHPTEAPGVANVARRCGGELRVSGEPGWTVRLEVVFPRCGRPARDGWNWLADADDPPSPRE